MKKEYKIFYAWQNDTENRVNRYFIRDALKRAIKNINKKLSIDEPERNFLALDHDTKNVPGMPEIVNTILQKIKDCNLFVADLTYIAESTSSDSIKFISNPNVIFELGYAFSAVGASKIFCIMNESFGKPDELFFDLVHRRWPITYCLLDNQDPNKNKILSDLSDKIENAILEILKNLNIEHPTKGKSAKLFTKAREEDFKFIYDSLNKDIKMEVRISDPKKSNIYGETSDSFILYFSCSLIELIMLYLSNGYQSVRDQGVENFLTSYLRHEPSFLKYSSIDLYVFIDDKNYITLLRTVGITRIKPNNYDEFNSKAYKFKYWLEYNNLIADTLEFKKIDVTK